MNQRTAAGPGWYVISLRPRGGHAGLRAAARRAGAGLLALPPCVIRPRDDADTRNALARALAAPRVVFTSPNAVSAAAAVQPLRRAAGALWCAVGAGTAMALRRARSGEVLRPTRMDSEGLLALPALQDIAGVDVGLVTAPGGRDMLAPALIARGARVLRADVYRREAIAPPAPAVAALAQLQAPAALALTSGEALQQVLAALPPDALACLRRAVVVAASPRLAEAARAAGFAHVALAAGPRPAQIVAAAQAAFVPNVR